MILLLTNADTELLTVRSILHRLPAGFPAVRAANPARLEQAERVPSLDGIDIVIVRLLGGRGSWEAPFDELRRRCLAEGKALVAVGGEATPDAEMASQSTVPAGIAAQAHAYLAAGGPGNVEACLRFLSDAITLTGFGFDPPAEIPKAGIFEAGTTARRDGRPLVGVVFYRAHLVAGNTTFIEDLAAALNAAGADVLSVFCYSLRPEAGGEVPALELCKDTDVLITTVLAMGGANTEDPDAWDVPQLAELGVPVLQAPSSSRPRHEWADDDVGLAPLDVAMGVAIPEFDGRIIGPAFAFKEEVDSGGDLGVTITATRADPERTARLAGMAVRLARLRLVPNRDKRVAVVLSAYPTKRSRLGNAVGLDTPASAIELLRTLQKAGWRVDRIPTDGDSLMAELSERLTYETPELTNEQAALAVGRLDADEYSRWFATLPGDAREQVEAMWGAAPGEVYLDRGELCFPGLDLGGVLVTIQPPRGFGADPIGTYHAPDMPPPHHYLAFYRWLSTGWGADAVVHVGKHGTLEWLPGKSNALSPSCFPDAAIGELPLVYPFVVNDPGEGTQAKRRAHAVIIDHLLPPMTRAETYDELARLERLLDTYAQAQAMDPSKLPALRRQVWDLLVDAEIHRDLGLGTEPGDDEFDHVVLNVDGYLCALKDAQIRGGLHILGQAPAGEALIDLVLAITRLPQGSIPSLRATVAGRLGLDLRSERRAEIDAIEAECRRQVEALANDGWNETGTADPTLRWIARRLVPDLGKTPHELDAILDRPGRPLCPGRAEWGPDPRRRPRPADRAQLLLGGPEGAAVTAVVGGRPQAGRRPDRAPRGRDRRPAPHRRAGPVGYGGHAHGWRRRRRGPRPARRPAPVAGGIRPGHRTGSHPDRRARPAPRGRHAAHLRLLPRRLPPPRRLARRCRQPGGRPRRGAGRQPGAGGGRRRRPHLRAATRRLRVGHPACPRAGLVAHRRRPGRGVPGLVGLRLPPGVDRRGWRPTRCAAGSRPSRWRPRTRTTASTTSSTATTTSRTTAAWSPPSGPSPARRPGPGSATRPTPPCPRSGL